MPHLPSNPHHQRPRTPAPTHRPLVPLVHPKHLPDKDVFCPAIELEHHTGHRYRTSGPILNFTAGMPDLKASPALGEHNHEILKEAGLTDQEIAATVG